MWWSKGADHRCHFVTTISKQICVPVNDHCPSPGYGGSMDNGGMVTFYKRRCTTCDRSYEGNRPGVWTLEELKGWD